MYRHRDDGNLPDEVAPDLGARRRQRQKSMQAWMPVRAGFSAADQRHGQGQLGDRVRERLGRSHQRSSGVRAVLWPPLRGAQNAGERLVGVLRRPRQQQGVQIVAR